MPAGVVKTKRDEEKWNKSKEIVRKQYPEMSEEDDSFWKIVNSIYQNMTKSENINLTLLKKSVELSFLCPDVQDYKTLAKDLYPLLLNHLENLDKSRKLHNKYYFQSLPISIENKKGSFRHWYDPMKDESGKTLMLYDYGYIRLTEGNDGEHVDCYVGSDKQAGRVYVVHQNNPKTGNYDEDKIFIGFNSAEEVKQAYLKHYNDPRFFGSISEYNMLTFKDKVFRKTGKITGGELQKSVRVKKNYSSDELKNLNMRWVTIRGNHVLVQGMSDGTFIVVGGAGGKLNHFKLDNILSEKEYRARQKEKQQANLADVTPEQLQEEAKKRKEDITSKKQYRQDYEQSIKDILGITADDIKSTITADEMDHIEKMVNDKVKKKKNETDEVHDEKIKKEVDKAAEDLVNKKIKDAEKQALNVLANDFFGENIGEGDLMATIKERIDADTAMEILKQRQIFKKKVKSLDTPKERRASKITDNYAMTSNDFTDQDVLDEVSKVIETQQNIRLYETLDAQSDAIQKHIDQGSVEALNGILGDIYGAKALFSSDVIESLGMEACVRMAVNKLYSDGKADLAKEALVKFAKENNAKTIKETLKETEKRFANADVIRGMAGKADDPEAILSIASANGYALRQLTRAQQVLGSAVGSVRIGAHLINAIEEGTQDKIYVEMGDNLAKARRKAKESGFKRTDYKIKTKSGTKQFVMEIPSSSTEKFFEGLKATKEERTTMDKIKSYEMNNGYVPDGMNPKCKNPRTGKVGYVELDAAQEAGLRFFAESNRVLLDFAAGLGKTAVGYAAIMEAINNKGAKKILWVVPAKLRTQTAQESKVFLNEENAKMVKNTDGKTPEQRKKIYESDGVHFIGHDQFRSDGKMLEAAGYDMVIVDEIHEMTNQRDTGDSGDSDSGRYKGMMKLANVPLKIGMSGTNIRSSKKELYKKINFIDPDHGLGSMKDFEKKYKGLNQGSNAFQDSSNDAFRKELGKWTYTQENKLPVKNNKQELRIPMTTDQKKAYKNSEKVYVEEKNHPNKSIQKAAAGRRESRNYDIIHNGMGAYENGKIQTIIKTMDEKHPGEKAVIHCYRHKAIKTCVKELEKKYGVGCVGVIDGDSAPGHVSKIKKAYNDPSNPLKFIIGTKSVEAGLNLQYGGRATFHLDIPQDEASRQQREGRQFRTGQIQDCESYLLVTETPFDISKLDNMERKGREMKTLHNPSTVAKDESGFLAVLNSLQGVA